MPDATTISAIDSVRAETGAVDVASSAGGDVCPVCLVALYHEASRAAQLVVAPHDAEGAPAVKVACCGGVFCLTCLQSSARYSTKCPLCRGKPHGCDAAARDCLLCDAQVPRHNAFDDAIIAAPAELGQASERARVYFTGNAVAYSILWLIWLSRRCGRSSRS
jgi:hypothetical protein